jgi:hypothetical protein
MRKAWTVNKVGPVVGADADYSSRGILGIPYEDGVFDGSHLDTVCGVGGCAALPPAYYGFRNFEHIYPLLSRQ